MLDLNLGTEPSRRRIPAILVAITAGCIIAGAVVWAMHERRGALSVARVQTYAAHSETRAVKSQPHVMGMAPHVDDDLYVVVTAKFTNRVGGVVTIEDETAVLTAPDGSVLDASAVPPSQLESLYEAFPALKPMVGSPLPPETEVAPGQTVEGAVVLYFPGAKEQNWTARKAATLTFAILHRDPETVTLP